MTGFDGVIRHGTVVTASDTLEADVGISGGKIQAIGANLPAGKKTIDATGRRVFPGGVDGHCQLDQPRGDGSVCADDFHSATVAAAYGGSTTVIRFACQMRGMPMQAAVDDYHRRAGDKAVIDYAFHRIVSDPTEALLKVDLPRLISQSGAGYQNATADPVLARCGKGRTGRTRAVSAMQQARHGAPQNQLIPFSSTTRVP